MCHGHFSYTSLFYFSQSSIFTGFEGMGQLETHSFPRSLPPNDVLVKNVAPSYLGTTLPSIHWPVHYLWLTPPSTHEPFQSSILGFGWFLVLLLWSSTISPFAVFSTIFFHCFIMYYLVRVCIEPFKKFEGHRACRNWLLWASFILHEAHPFRMHSYCLSCL